MMRIQLIGNTIEIEGEPVADLRPVAHANNAYRQAIESFCALGEIPADEPLTLCDGSCADHD